MNPIRKIVPRAVPWPRCLRATLSTIRRSAAGAGSWQHRRRPSRRRRGSVACTGPRARLDVENPRRVADSRSARPRRVSAHGDRVAPDRGTGVVARRAESFAFTRLQTNRPAATRPIPSGCDEDLLVHVVGGFPVLAYDVAEPPHRDGLAVELTLENRGPPTVFFGQVAVEVYARRRRELFDIARCRS